MPGGNVGQSRFDRKPENAPSGNRPVIAGRARQSSARRRSRQPGAQRTDAPYPLSLTGYPHAKNSVLDSHAGLRDYSPELTASFHLPVQRRAARLAARSRLVSIPIELIKNLDRPI